MTPRAKRWLRYAVVLLLAYVFFMLSEIPAGFAYHQLLTRVGGRAALQLQGVQGTLWHGSAREASLAGLDLGHLEWRLSFLGLLRARLNTDVEARGQGLSGRGHLSLARDGARALDDAQATVTASALAPLLGRLPVRLGGVLSAKIEQASMRAGQGVAITGRIAWSDAQLTAPRPMTLGNFVVTLEPAEGGTKGVISDQGGPTQADGLVRIKADGSYTLALKLAPRNPAQAQALSALSALGRADKDGAVQINWSGRLPGW